MSTLPTDNLSIVLAPRTSAAGVAEWLRQVDAADRSTFEWFLSRGCFDDACAFLLGHLERTEVTRTRVHGAGPSWDDAVAGFNRAVDRHASATGGVNATRPPVACSGPAGPKGTSLSVVSLCGDLEPCAPGGHLTPVPGPECGHVSDLNGMRCIRDQHPRNPGGHYYVASNGSDVPDHHTATEAQEV